MIPDDRPLSLLLVGFGHVARRFARMLRELEPRLLAEHGVRTEVVGIATATRGCRYSARGLDAVRLAERIEAGHTLDDDPPLDSESLPNADALMERAATRQGARLVMVETTPLDVVRAEPATSHVRKALALGMDVTTANKGPVAHAFHELARVASRRGRRFLFEGTVLDGTPVFNLVRSTLPAVTITGFRGVINSTTNAILTNMERGTTFEQALALMQAKGIAEADPSLDIDGWDAAAKTAALMNVLMGARTTPQHVSRAGIRGLSVEDLERARAAGQRIKLVASAWTEPSGPQGCVRPEWLGPDDPLATLEGTANGLVLETNVFGRLGIWQLDADLTNTAYALVSDLIAIASGR